MSQILKLFKFQLDNKYNLFKSRDKKEFFISLFKSICLILAITLVLYLIMKKIFNLLFIKVDQNAISIVLLVTQGISFAFAIANTISTLYLSKDNELLMVLPVTFNQLFVSKIMVLYVSELIFNTLYMLPVFLCLGWLGKLSGVYFASLIFIIPLLPLLPIALASIISIPIMFVLKFFKRHTVLSIITILVVVATVFVAYMSFVTKLSSVINIAEKQVSTGLKINNWLVSIGPKIWIYYQIALSMLSFKYFYFPLAFLMGSLLLVVLCFALIKPFYYKVSTINMETTSVIRSKHRPFKYRSVFAELLVNEIRMVFRSPGYIFQFFLFPLFMPLIVFTYDKLLINIAVNQAGQNMIFGSHMLILGIIALMSNTISSIAISKEGGTFYIAKTTPINYKVQAMAKLTFNAIFTVGAILVTTIIALIFTNLNVWVTLLSSLTVTILALGHICHSFDLDLQHPVLDWYDNSEISTIGKNTTKSMIYALALPVLLCLIVTLFGIKGIFIALAVSVVYLVGRIHLLSIRLNYYYTRMEI